jgi:hypothetical protein
VCLENLKVDEEVQEYTPDKQLRQEMCQRLMNYLAFINRYHYFPGPDRANNFKPSALS